MYRKKTYNARKTATHRLQNILYEFALLIGLSILRMFLKN